MIHHNTPYIDEYDPLINYYGQINQKQILDIINKFPDFRNKDIISSLLLDYTLLLDFYDINLPHQYNIFKDIFKILPQNNNVFCFAWDYKEIEKIIFDYEPPMIIKYNTNIDILSKLSQSFMQIQTGAFALVDDNKEFYSIVVDGYYCITLLRKKHINIISKYLKNFNDIDKRVDEITALSLKEMFL